MIGISSGQSLIRYTHKQFPHKAFSVESVLVEDRHKMDWLKDCGLKVYICCNVYTLS